MERPSSSLLRDVEHEDIPQTEDVESASAESGGKKRKLLSKIWDDYTFIPSTKVGEPDKVKCKHYDKVYNATFRNGTTTMTRHREKHKTIQSPVEGSSYADEISGLSRPLNQEHIRDLIAKAIIRHGYPFSWVEHEGVRDIFMALNENVKTICRNTAKADCLKMHGFMKEKLRQSLQRVPSRICLTCDLWSACTTEGYLCLTTHYIDQDWKLNSKVLNFCHFPPPHTGQLLFGQIYRLLRDWGIKNKIFSITLDNASSNDVMQQLLCDKLNSRNVLPCRGKFFHIRCAACAAHILNLIVKEGLKVIDRSVVKVRESVKYINGSGGRKSKFKECIEDAGYDCKSSLWMDVLARWNSTYKILKKALIYCNAFEIYARADLCYVNCPTSDEWHRIRKIYTLLEPFNEITNLFSGSNYPTANLYFEKVWSIQLRLQREMQSLDVVICDMAMRMKEKFDKYWRDYNTVLSFAVILDPRYKMEFLKFCYCKLYEDANLAKQKLEQVYNDLQRLFMDYTRSSENSFSTPTTFASMMGIYGRDVTEQHQFDERPLSDVAEFGAHYSEFSARNSPLDLYLNEERMDHRVKLDILSYWKVNAARFKELSLLAMDVLSVPITTVASESTFSVGGRVLNKWRSSLLSENVEALITTRSWLYSYDGYENEDKEMGKSVDFINSNETPLPPNTMSFESGASNTRN